MEAPALGLTPPEKSSLTPSGSPGATETVLRSSFPGCPWNATGRGTLGPPGRRKRENWSVASSPMSASTAAEAPGGTLTLSLETGTRATRGAGTERRQGPLFTAQHYQGPKACPDHRSLRPPGLPALPTPAIWGPAVSGPYLSLVPCFCSSPAPPPLPRWPVASLHSPVIAPHSLQHLCPCIQLTSMLAAWPLVP